MTKFKLFFLFLLVTVLISSVKSQDCTVYFPEKIGTEMETTAYDKKGKVTSISRFKILEVNQTEKGQEIRAESEIEIPDEKDPVVRKSEVVFYCKDGKFYIDMEQYLKDMNMEAYESMDISMESQDMELPANPKAGDVLEDGNLTVVVRNNNVKLVTMTIDIVNRVVESIEEVTTPAGTFECFKLNYDVKSKIGFIKQNYKNSVWYAKEVGAVKSEIYDKKGKLNGTTLLTKFRK